MYSAGRCMLDNLQAYFLQPTARLLHYMAPQ